MTALQVRRSSRRAAVGSERSQVSVVRLPQGAGNSQPPSESSPASPAAWPTPSPNAGVASRVTTRSSTAAARRRESSGPPVTVTPGRPARACSSRASGRDRARPEPREQCVDVDRQGAGAPRRKPTHRHAGDGAEGEEAAPERADQQLAGDAVQTHHRGQHATRHCVEGLGGERCRRDAEVGGRDQADHPVRQWRGPDDELRGVVAVPGVQRHVDREAGGHDGELGHLAVALLEVDVDAQGAAWRRRPAPG